MNKKEIAEKARAAFGAYAALDTPHLPENPLSALQVRLARWQSRNFGVPENTEICLGIAEEAGELCHAILKAKQKIRGYEDPEFLRAEAADAMADCTVYMMQLATALRMDFGTFFFAVAEEVLKRDWVKDSLKGGEVAA